MSRTREDQERLPMDGPAAPLARRLSEADQARILAEQTRDVIFRYRVTPEPGFEYVSPACTAIIGYAPEEFYANPDLAEELIHPDDRPLLLALWNVNSGPCWMRLRYIHRDGHIVWIEQQHRIIASDDGEELVLEGSGRDISAYANAEVQLKLLSTALETSSNAVMITSVDGAIRWINPAFTQLTGYGNEEAIGASSRLLRSGRNEPRLYEDLWKTVLAGRTWSGQLINRRKDGSFYHEEQTITPVLIDGVVTHLVAVKQDVSLRFARERERESLLVMASALRTARTRAEMLPTLLRQTMMLLRAVGALLSLREETTSQPIFELGVGVWTQFTGRYPTGAHDITLQVLANGRPFHGPPPPELGTNTSLEGHSAACVPLRVHEATLGALWVVCPHPLHDDDLSLFTGIADMAANAIQRTTLFEQTERRLQRLISLQTIDQAITSSLDKRLSLRVLVDQAQRQLGVDAATVLLLNNAEHTLDYTAGQGLQDAYPRSVSVRLDVSLAGMAVRERRRIWIKDLSLQAELDERHRLLAGAGFRAYIATPLIAQGQIMGVLEVLQRRALNPEPEWLDYLDTLAGRAAVAIDNAELFGRLQRSHSDLVMAYDTTLEGWSRALDLRDKETEGHSRRVTELTVRLARAMGLSEAEIVHVRRGALLHDIGKMGIPDAILLKPGPLTDEEWAIMRRHPTYGYQLLAPIAHLHPALDIPYYHHEKWDGSGYPHGLAGESIPLPARIFAIVDVWDALRSDRPYRTAWDVERVREYLREEAGHHFDPKVVAAFLELAIE
ncbi:MAG: PAS domain S-box protein [Candidatus Viridilinea halotolerans]|uniref:PAS domain S-box protein n=1 Tax=Candidatus Viridilinea halotolerans TaxID=2491704 RepID=A0A426TQW2_9CHLR|nr:MAG: PAS domain S-box protein [Candidatus Viridilinea halotolerans]